MDKIRLSKSIVGELEKKALCAVMDEGYLGMGSFVQAFEEKLSGFFGGSNVTCVNSGTAALHLALMALNLNKGDEVLVQSLTYVASFQAISASGLKPVACEVMLETGTIDLKDAKRKITNKTKAIMPVHYSGRVGNLKQIYAFAKKHKLRVVEDAAHAFGSIYNGKKVGSFGDIACFSFDGIKNITSGEGGAIVTRDNRVTQFVKDARLLGVKKDTDNRFKGMRSWEFDVSNQGYRYHMSNLFAAIGIAQMKRFEKSFKSKRQKLAQRYHKMLSGIEGLKLFPDEYNDVVPHIFVVRVLRGKRDHLRDNLFNSGIECGVHYHPNHMLTYYNRGLGHKLPVTEKLYNELLSLPLHPDLTNKEQDRVIKNIINFLMD
ncbi:MAG: DegT/DnrJ/EryC1/StrS family aminotransferase [Parcubacteria group bacterium]|nr:DegT/DnrJ/EryC1/StrS family aminotransferase [Parcubacteria group bacterium]